MILYSSMIISATIYLCFNLYFYLYPTTYNASEDIIILCMCLRYVAIIVIIYSIIKAIILSNDD